tara:strand:- start:8852 stop:9718 length:867 start_codon:yes stop_codon:yes gene_type:complete
LIGIFSALGAASAWTYASYLWTQQTKELSPSQINITKNIIACCIFSPFLFTLDVQISFKEIFILLLSGIIGISIGDTFYIISLKNLGTRRTLTVEALSPIFATLLGALFLQEILSIKVWLGVFIVSLSLIGVARKKTHNSQDNNFKTDKSKGFLFAFLSVLCAVIAATLSRFVLVNSNINPFQSTEIRLIGSIISLIPFMRKNYIYSIKKLSSNTKLTVLYATFLGTNIGILLQQNVFKTLPIGLGWTLLSTSPVIALFAAKAEGEKLDWETLILTITTMLGVILVFV